MSLRFLLAIAVLSSVVRADFTYECKSSQIEKGEKLPDPKPLKNLVLPERPKLGDKPYQESVELENTYFDYTVAGEPGGAAFGEVYYETKDGTRSSRASSGFIPGQRKFQIEANFGTNKEPGPRGSLECNLVGPKGQATLQDDVAYVCGISQNEQAANVEDHPPLQPLDGFALSDNPLTNILGSEAKNSKNAVHIFLNRAARIQDGKYTFVYQVMLLEGALEAQIYYYEKKGEVLATIKTLIDPSQPQMKLFTWLGDRKIKGPQALFQCASIDPKKLKEMRDKATAEKSKK